MISTGRPTSTASFTVTSLLTAATLLITGIATFQSIFANTRITTPSIVTTSTGLGIDVQNGGDIVASSTGSNIWIGGVTSSTGLTYVNATGTNTTSTNLYAANLAFLGATGTGLSITGTLQAASTTVTSLNFTNATGTLFSLSGYLREGLYVTSRLGHANTPTVEYIGAGDGCQARITATSSSAPTYQATSTALCNP